MTTSQSQCVSHNMISASNLQLVAKERRQKDQKMVHVRSSGLKAAATWHRVEILQACRECCGGQGEGIAGSGGVAALGSMDIQFLRLPSPPWASMFEAWTIARPPELASPDGTRCTCISQGSLLSIRSAP